MVERAFDQSDKVQLMMMEWRRRWCGEVAGFELGLGYDKDQ
jgi:hypothetical protein